MAQPLKIQNSQAKEPGLSANAPLALFRLQLAWHMLNKFFCTAVKFIVASFLFQVGRVHGKQLRFRLGPRGNTG